MQRALRLAALVALLVLAAALRLADPGGVRFERDQINHLRAGSAWIAGEALPASGPNIGQGSSAWGGLGPVPYAITGLAWAAGGRSIEGALVVLALAHVAMIALLWRLGAVVSGGAAGWIAALLLAVAPYPVQVARELVNYAWVPPLVALALLGLVEATRDARARWPLLAIANLALAAQLHAGVWLLLPIALVSLARSQRGAPHPGRRALLLAAIGLAAGAPFLWLQVRSGWPVLGGLAEAFSATGGETARDPMLAIRRALGVLSESSIAPRCSVSGIAETRGLLPALILVGSVCALAARRHAGLLVAAAFWATPLALPLVEPQALERFFVAIFPAAALLAAAGLWIPARALGARLPEGWAPLPACVAAALALALAASLTLLDVAQRRAASSACWIAEGPTLEVQRRFADRLLEDPDFRAASGHPSRAPQLIHGDDLRFLVAAERAALELDGPDRDAAPPDPRARFTLLHDAAPAPPIDGWRSRCCCPPFAERDREVKRVVGARELHREGPWLLLRHESAILPGALSIELDGTAVVAPSLPMGVGAGVREIALRVELDAAPGDEPLPLFLYGRPCLAAVHLDGARRGVDGCAAGPARWDIATELLVPRATRSLEIELRLDERPTVLDLHDSPVIVGPLADGAPVRPPWNDLIVHDLTTP